MNLHLNPPQLIFVDDNQDFLESSRMVFGSDHSVVTFDSAEKVMEFTRNLSSPAIFFVDMCMRYEGDGIELIQDINSIARLPVICYCLSGNKDSGTKRNALSSGAAAYITKPAEKGEIDGYIVAAKRIICNTNNATRDHLTGLLNRREFDNIGSRELGQALRRKRQIVCLFFDIDNFKSINDTYSHLTGDSVIQSVADCFSAHEWRSTDVVCRYGGDEFVILLPETTEKQAQRIVRQLKSTVSSTVQHCGDGRTFHISLSVGFAKIDFDTAAQDARVVLKGLVDRSSLDMKKAKSRRRSGTGRVIK